MRQNHCNVKLDFESEIGERGTTRGGDRAHQIDPIPLLRSFFGGIANFFASADLLSFGLLLPFPNVDGEGI